MTEAFRAVEALALAHEDYLIGMRRHFHRHPEVSREERETSRAVRRELEALGLEVHGSEAHHGLFADIEGAAPGRTLLLRSDMDALPVPEKTGCGFASLSPGVSHACGHDCHMAMLLSAARVLVALRDRFAGRVRLCFQPAEEIGAGAQMVIGEGWLEGVDATFAVHVWSDIDAGKASVMTGPCMASCDRFAVKVRGRGCHGSQPYLGVDTVAAAAQVVCNLQSIVSRELSPFESVVITVASLQAGTSWNIIPGEALLRGTTRTFSNPVRATLEERIRRVATQVAAAHRCEAELEYEYLSGPVINDPAVAGPAREAALAVFGPGGGSYSYGLMMASEDYSMYGERAPSALALLGVRSEEADSGWPQHSERYKVDESALVKGVMLHALTALNYLGAA
ncbi:MAG: amidohydrolase [Duodenibacillus sp.]|nr:amidohydrolase [Duodenibacillus sp.]